MPEELGAHADAARNRETALARRVQRSVHADRAFLDTVHGAAGACQFQRFLTAKTRDIHRVIADTAADPSLSDRPEGVPA